MRTKVFFWIGCCLLGMLGVVRAQLPIIPQPVEISKGTGVYLLHTSAIILSDSQNWQAGIYLRDYLARYYKLNIFLKPIPAGKGKTGPGGNLTASLPAKGTAVPASAIWLETGAVDGPDGSYSLDVTPSGIRIGGKGAGVFYGIQSLLQLLPASMRRDAAPAVSQWPIPICRISDAPRFAWRGLSLDVSRHFFPVEEVKKYIDMMAHYKLNVFHWHLTDDEGWRIQIDKYPRLTQYGARISYWATLGKFRKLDNLIDGGNDGFYTKDDIRAVIKYAKERYVTILPEIEMPGHSEAAIFAYPELGCKDSTGAVHRVRMLDPSEHTFHFLQDVLTEVMELFPNEYIHIGGDEAEMADWWKSPVAVALMKKEGLKNEKEVQSYFIRRIEKFLLSKNKKLIGWDEILQGGLAPSATVMSWQGEDGGIAAAKLHHPVVMTPLPYMYFDAPQGKADLEPRGWNDAVPWQMVYNYEVFPRELTADEAHYIMGAQANIWTELIAGSPHLEYMVYPRVLAVAELTWTPQAQKDIHRFEESMYRQYDLFKLWGLQARLPDIGEVRDIVTNKDMIDLSLTYPLKEANLLYEVRRDLTGDGARQPPLISGKGGFPQRIPIPVKDSCRLSTITVVGWNEAGAMQKAMLRRVQLQPPTSKSTLNQGLSYALFHTTLNNPAVMDTLQEISGGKVTDPAGLGSLTIPMPSGDTSNWIRLTGYCRIDREADYSVRSGLPKSPFLYLGDGLILRGNADAWLQPQEAILHLQPGFYAIRGYFPADRQNGQQLFLTIKSTDGTVLLPDAYWH